MGITDLHIKKIRVENYKSLKDTEIELKEGFNVIIGENGAGKSNILDFIYKHASRPPLTNSSRANRNTNNNFFVSFQYINEGKKSLFSYSVDRIKSSSNTEKTTSREITINKIENKQHVIKDKKVIVQETESEKIRFNSVTAILNDEEIKNEFAIISRLGRQYISFQLPDSPIWLAKPIKLVIDPDENFSVSVEEDSFSEFGFFSNLELDFIFGELSLLNVGEDTAAIKEKTASFLSNYISKSSINKLLKDYSPISEVRFNPNLNIYLIEQKVFVENVVLEFYINGEWVPWSFLSDGTKRLFYIISEVNSLKVGVLLIEEPELGIHPHQLYKLLDFLKEQSRAKQIIISTHSPLVLDTLSEKELDRIIIAKYENGTKFRHLNKAEISKAKKYMTEVGDLSTYWLHSDLEK